VDRIALRGLRVFGHHGVLPAERTAGQSFVIDVVLGLDTRPAALADDLTLTVDYAAIATRVVDAVGRDPANLIETVAHRVAELCLAAAHVAEVEVTVHKPRAPVGVSFDDIAVTIHRRRT